MANLRTVDCGTHGKAYRTLLCSHLVENPVQQWFYSQPAEDDPWPVAWCALCHIEYKKEGEWNEKNKDIPGMRVACHLCYEDARARSVDHLQSEEIEAWETFLASCCEELSEKQDDLWARFDLSVHPRWDVNQTTGQLIFSNDGVPKVIADVQYVGSISTISGTWLWSWANFSILETVKGSILQVCDFGYENHFPHLTIPKWYAGEEDGWHMAAIAAHLLNGKGVYRTPKETGFTFLLITDIRWADATSNAPS
jgi:hypothetical protein